MNFNAEIIEKAKAANSAEELLKIAKAGGVEMTAQEAATFFAQLNPKSGELDDDELDNVAGGACKSSNDDQRACPCCSAALKSIVGSEDTMKFKCSSCNAEFAAYAKEGFSILHRVN